MNDSWLDKGLVSVLLSIAQLLMPAVAAIGTLVVLIIAFPVAFKDSYQILAALGFVVTLLVFKDVSRSTELRDQDYLSHVWRSFGHWLLVIGILAFFGYALKISAEFSRRVLLTWTVVTPFVIGAGQLFMDRLFMARMRAYGGRRSAIIAGVNDYSRRLGKALMQHPRLGTRMLGYFDDRSRDRLGLKDSDPLLGRLDELPGYVRRHGVEVIYIALPITHEERTRQIIDELQDTTASIYFVPDIFVFDLIQSSVDMIEGIPILGLCESPYIGINKMIKKLSDVAIASLLLLAAAPVLAVIAVGVKLTSSGSVIFQQRRYGMDGNEII
ncbi:MAG: sugar transferase, partial [Chlorobiales bacterium]|nr:sugar transferase [Chlorobiales bacterium]